MDKQDSMRVLKANDLRGLGSKIVFNYEDLRGRCDEYVEKVRQDARRMLQEAHAEAERLKQQTHDEARDAGRREGLRDAEAEIARRSDEAATRLAAERLTSVLPALQQTAQSLACERDRWLAEWETAAVRLSVAIAEKLVGRSLELNPDLAPDRIRHILELAAGQPRLRLRLHPADLDRLGENAAEVVRSLACCGEAELVPDASIAQGGCIIETQHGVIDGRLETQLERITAELLGE